MSWYDRAACAGQDSADWSVATGYHGKPTKRMLRAVEICGTCPVTVECGMDAERAGKAFRRGQIRAGVIYNDAGDVAGDVGRKAAT